MRVITLLVVLMLVSVFGNAYADQTPVGVCGGVTWIDDPDLEHRLYLVSENDLDLLSLAVQQIKSTCTVISLSLYQADGCRASSRFQCAVIVASCESASPSNQELTEFIRQSKD